MRKFAGFLGLAGWVAFAVVGCDNQPPPKPTVPVGTPISGASVGGNGSAKPGSAQATAAPGLEAAPGNSDNLGSKAK